MPATARAPQHALGSDYALGDGVPKDYVQAHMWFNFAASRASDAEVRKEMAKFRDIVAAKMTPAQIAEARKNGARVEADQVRPRLSC